MACICIWHAGRVPHLTKLRLEGLGVQTRHERPIVLAIRKRLVRDLLTELRMYVVCSMHMCTVCICTWYAYDLSAICSPNCVCIWYAVCTCTWSAYVYGMHMTCRRSAHRTAYVYVVCSKCVCTGLHMSSTYWSAYGTHMYMVCICTWYAYARGLTHACTHRPSLRMYSRTC